MTTGAANPLFTLKALKIVLPVLLAAFVVLSADPAFSKNKSSSAESSNNSTEASKSDKKKKKSKKEQKAEIRNENSKKEAKKEAKKKAKKKAKKEALKKKRRDKENDTDKKNKDDIKLSSPTKQKEKETTSESSSTSIFRRPEIRLSEFERNFKKTQKEWSRLFLLSDDEVTNEFPDGGFDTALVNAASKARKAERAFDRRKG